MSPRGSKSILAPRSSGSALAASPAAAGMWLLNWGVLRCVVVFRFRSNWLGLMLPVVLCL